MATDYTKSFTDIDILFSDEATVPQWSAFCGVDTATISVNTSTNSFDVPPCPPTSGSAEPTYTQDEISAVQWVVTIEAFHNEEFWDFIDDWVMNNINETKTIRIYNTNASSADFYYTLPVKLINPSLSGSYQEKWRTSITLNGQDKPTKVSVP